MPPEEIESVAHDFLRCVRTELEKERRGLLRYCLHYREDRSWWGPDSEEQPYFFAMLWLTCLVAYGFPSDGGGDFHARMRAALGTAAGLQGGELGELDDVWEDLEKWTHTHPEYRDLALPPRCSHRTIIGRSHFLAFPHRSDRVKLVSVLQTQGLIGQEPPVRPVLEALRKEQAQFSREFRADLHFLLSEYIEQGRDLKESPFWRAVRQAALDIPVHDSTGQACVGHAGLLAEWDDDELLTLFVAFSADWITPVAWPTGPLEFRIGDLSQRAFLDEVQLGQVIAKSVPGFRAGEQRAVEEGFIPLLEEASGLYRVALAEEIASSEMALVREQLVSGIQREFGGRTEPSGVFGWILLTHARFAQRDNLGAELSSVRSLWQTTDAPRPAMVGGIRASGNTFYGLDVYLPLVRTRHAREVTVRSDDGEYEAPCTRVPDNAEHWQLPDAVAEGSRMIGSGSAGYEVIALYDVDILSHRVTRESRTNFSIQIPVLATAFKGLPSGAFRLETCARKGETVIGPQISLSLDFMSTAFDRVLDVLPFDPSARRLGPGFGQMSTTDTGFPWLVVGPKNHPEYLVLDVEDLDTAASPSDHFSPFVGDRRHWAKALSKATPTWWKHGEAYTSEDQWPTQAKELLKKYRQRVNAKHRNVHPVTETHLDSQLRDAPWGVAGSASQSVHDVIAALSENRAGLPLREVHEHISRLLNLGDAHHLREQLVRALVESGAVDSLRRTDGRQTLVVARAPRLLAFRRGPHWVAVLLGVTASPVRNEFRMATARFDGVTLEEGRSANIYLPGMMRVTVAERSQLLALSNELGFLDPEYVRWADRNQLPDPFRISGELCHDPVPDMYVADATWCWSSRSFRRNPEVLAEVSVERRRDGQRVPIYVVKRGDVVVGWSYYRTWALLSAHEAFAQPFLKEEETGTFAVVGDSPLHLPLPLARLCAIVGLGTPGPRTSPTDPLRVEAYCYPFGPHLSRLLRPFLPPSWFLPRES